MPRGTAKSVAPILADTGRQIRLGDASETVAALLILIGGLWLAQTDARMSSKRRGPNRANRM